MMLPCFFLNCLCFMAMLWTSSPYHPDASTYSSGSSSSPPSDMVPSATISRPPTTEQEDMSTESSTTKRKSRSRKYMDDEEKRKNFLERNRQAALKCRQRKKQWLNDLQARADFLAADNEQLQLHVCALRDEIIHLQTLLYAHRDCPVTQKQQRFAVAAAGAVPVQPSPYPTFQSMLHPPPQEETPPDLISGHPGLLRLW